MKIELVEPTSSRVEAIWTALEREAKPIYFLTWGWMENWLACLPRADAPDLAVITRDGEPQAACFVARRRMIRHRVLRSRTIHVNSTGSDAFDDLCLEHNGLLARPGSGVTLATVIEQLPGAWDELYIPAADVDTIASLSALRGGLRIKIDREVADHVVDLARVRERGYPALLGASTRAQLRKTQRAAGDLAMQIAADDREAIDIYDELVALHQRSWRARGQPGAFADPWFDRFHRRLIARRFAHGELQLIRVTNAQGTIGCLYNFVSAGRVLFYQSGFAAFEHRHMKPGYLCHAAAIEHCAKAGHAIYDLLGGDARYKKSLATDETKLVWGRVQQPRWVFALEDRARVLVRELRALRARNRKSPLTATAVEAPDVAESS